VIRHNIRVDAKNNKNHKATKAGKKVKGVKTKTHKPIPKRASPK
jgi:hypothetical protein